MKMQPQETVYLKTNVKSPGFTATPVQSELEVTYDTRFFQNENVSNPDAYTRLLVDVLRGRHEAFVRDDELRRAWEIFTPVLNQIENENVRPIIYKQGTRVSSISGVSCHGLRNRRVPHIFRFVHFHRAPRSPTNSFTRYAEAPKCNIGFVMILSHRKHTHNCSLVHFAGGWIHSQRRLRLL